MYRICSASGTTTSANENIMEAIKEATLQKGKGSSECPFILHKINLFLKSNSVVYFNTKSEDIAEGLNKTFVKETFPTSGEYVVATTLKDIAISNIVIESSGTEWEITFLY